ncbi:hypothetical protein D3C85_249280 [compost metagenome]
MFQQLVDAFDVQLDDDRQEVVVLEARLYNSFVTRTVVTGNADGRHEGRSQQHCTGGQSVHAFAIANDGEVHHVRQTLVDVGFQLVAQAGTQGAAVALDRHEALDLLAGNQGNAPLRSDLATVHVTAGVFVVGALQDVERHGAQGVDQHFDTVFNVRHSFLRLSGFHQVNVQFLNVRVDQPAANTFDRQCVDFEVTAGQLTAQAASQAHQALVVADQGADSFVVDVGTNGEGQPVHYGLVAVFAQWVRNEERRALTGQQTFGHVTHVEHQAQVTMVGVGQTSIRPPCSGGQSSQAINDGLTYASSQVDLVTSGVLDVHHFQRTGVDVHSTALNVSLTVDDGFQTNLVVAGSDGAEHGASQVSVVVGDGVLVDFQGGQREVQRHGATALLWSLHEAAVRQAFGVEADGVCAEAQEHGFDTDVAVQGFSVVSLANALYGIDLADAEQVDGFADDQTGGLDSAATVDVVERGDNRSGDEVRSGSGVVARDQLSAVVVQNGEVDRGVHYTAQAEVRLGTVQGVLQGVFDVQVRDLDVDTALLWGQRHSAVDHFHGRALASDLVVQTDRNRQVVDQRLVVVRFGGVDAVVLGTVSVSVTGAVGQRLAFHRGLQAQQVGRLGAECFQEGSSSQASRVGVFGILVFNGGLKNTGQFASDLRQMATRFEAAVLQGLKQVACFGAVAVAVQQVIFDLHCGNVFQIRHTGFAVNYDLAHELLQIAIWCS